MTDIFNWLFLPICFVLIVYCTPKWKKGSKATPVSDRMNSTQWSCLYSSNFKVYWDWLDFANNSQANSSTKHDVRKRLGRLAGLTQHRNRRLMVDCKNVQWPILSTKKEKNKSAQEHLNLPKKQSRCKNRTVFFLFSDYLPHFVTNTGLW